MIIDKIANHRLYRFGKHWEKAFEFLSGLNAESEDGEYPIDGERMFARVLSYETRLPEESVLEAHRQYVDIQTVLRGKEGFRCFPIETLTTKTDYNEKTDVVFFDLADNDLVRIDLIPGRFVVFFPDDAHMPMLQVGGQKESIKKVVIKVRVELLREQ